jgi:2'-5' RNA ligase
MRLFIAVPVPEYIADDLADLCSGIPGARWVPPENFHITLRFLGEIDGAQADDVHEALSRIIAPGFEISLSSVGTFGDQKKTRALWAGVDPSPALVHLRDKVESAAVRAGLPPEPRRFKPHVTLARFKNGSAMAPEIHQFITRNALYRSEAFFVERFTLFQSFLGGEGAIYRPEVDYELARRAA